MAIWLYGEVVVNEHIIVNSNSFAKVNIFKCLGTLLINEHSIHEETKCRHRGGNSCHYSVQRYLLGLSLRILKTKIYKAITLSIVLYGSETSYHILWWT